nr:MAG TPA: hypothetical protein [Caudoviricetes sp.]
MWRCSSRVSQETEWHACLRSEIALLPIGSI